MSRKVRARKGNPDLRQQKHVPAPPIEQIEKQIFSLLSPGSFKPLKFYSDKEEQKKKLRDRILTRPVMMALVIGLVYRQIPGLRELQRVLSEEGLLWVGQIEVSTQAISKRLQKLPIELFAQIFEQVMARISVQQVCELYRRRWRVEDAFLLTKRLLGLAYIWVGDKNGLQIQILATWIFDAVLNQLCIDVAIALNQPIERISTEMVFRGLYHFSQAILRGDTSDAVPYLVERQKLFGLVKARRKRQSLDDAYTQQIWALSS